MLEFWASSASPLTSFLCSVLDGIAYRYVLVSSMLIVVVMAKTGESMAGIKEIVDGKRTWDHID